MSIVAVTTVLDAPPSAVWRAVITPAAFRFVSRGVVRLRAFDTVEGPASPGLSVTGPLRVLGVPLSRHRITIERVDHVHRELQSDEGGGIITSWRHLISVEPIAGDPGRSRYTDRIEIRAGILTPAVALFAHGFYRVRQRRWRTLAPVLAAVSLVSIDPG